MFLSKSMFFTASVLFATLSAGCNDTASFARRNIPGLEIFPAQENVIVGSIYRNTAESKNSGRLALNKVCSFNPSIYNLRIGRPSRIEDIELTSEPSFSASLEGIKTTLATAGLSGSFSDYFGYKLTNVQKIEADEAELNLAFGRLIRGPACGEWYRTSRGTVVAAGGQVLQISAIYVGDFVVEQKPSTSISPEISLKLGKITPKIKATLATKNALKRSGKGLVIRASVIDRS
jgi:hypothetical protein